MTSFTKIFHYVIYTINAVNCADIGVRGLPSSPAKLTLLRCTFSDLHEPLHISSLLESSIAHEVFHQQYDNIWKKGEHFNVTYVISILSLIRDLTFLSLLLNIKAVRHSAGLSSLTRQAESIQARNSKVHFRQSNFFSNIKNTEDLVL
jgi:hypothetical protein